MGGFRPMGGGAVGDDADAQEPAVRQQPPRRQEPSGLASRRESMLSVLHLSDDDDSDDSTTAPSVAGSVTSAYTPYAPCNPYVRDPMRFSVVQPEALMRQGYAGSHVGSYAPLLTIPVFRFFTVLSIRFQLSQ